MLLIVPPVSLLPIFPAFYIFDQIDDVLRHQLRRRPADAPLRGPRHEGRRVELGRGVTVGANATVLYDSKVGDFARLRPLTIVMKGESIPAHTEWEGAPAVPVVHQAEELKQAA